MKVSTQCQSRFLTHEDIPAPVIVTMHHVAEDLSLRNPYVLHFDGDRLKPLPLNVTNRRIIVAAFGDDSANWQGKRIEVYFDASVPNPRDPSRPGGIKVRIPAAAPKQETPLARRPQGEMPAGTLAQHRTLIDCIDAARSNEYLEKVKAWGAQFEFSAAQHEEANEHYRAALERIAMAKAPTNGRQPTRASAS